MLSISQLCEKGYNCLFTHEDVTVSRREDSSIVFAGHLRGKLYYVDFKKVKVDPKACLMAKSDLGWLWHRRLAHVGMRNLLFLRKIGYVVHVKSGSKLELIIPPRTSCPHQDHWSYYTWICLDQSPT
jgi:hypothetical protein